MLEKEFIEEYAAQATQSQRAEVIKAKLEPVSPKLAAIMNNLNEGKTTTFEAINEMRKDYKDTLPKGINYIEHEGNAFTDKANQIAGALPIKRSEYAFEVNRLNAAGYLSPNERELFNDFIKEAIDEKGLKDGLASVQADKKAYIDKLKAVELSDAAPFDKRNEVKDLQMEYSNKGVLSKNQEKAIDKVMDSSINDQLTISNADIKTLATRAEYHGYAGNIVSNNLMSVIEAKADLEKDRSIADLAQAKERDVTPSITTISTVKGFTNEFDSRYIESKGDGYITLLSDEKDVNGFTSQSFPLTEELVEELNEVESAYEAIAILERVKETEYADVILSRDVQELIEHSKDGVIENGQSGWRSGKDIAETYLSNSMLFKENGEEAKGIVKELDSWLDKSKYKAEPEKEQVKEQSPENDKVKRDLRQEFTDKLVASLEQGTIPWRKPWNADKTVNVGMPTNALTGKPYRGGNLLMLAVESAEKGYQDNRWATFNQVKELGGNVMKGQSATPIEYWERRPFFVRSDVQITEPSGKRVFFDMNAKQTADIITAKDGRPLNKASLRIENDSKQYTWKQAEAQLDSLIQKTHFVFNVEQAENLKLPPLATELPEFEKNAKAEAIAQGMQKDGVTIMSRDRDAAFYSPAIDVIQMPPRSAFENEAGYYGTLLHELGHATGHENRLNRDHKSAFGSKLYAKEELVAEITSAFTSMETGIPFDGANHQAYIKNWAEVIKEDKNAIYVAARDASKASDYLIEKGKEIEQTLEHKHTLTRDNEVEDEKVKEPVIPVVAKESEQIVIEADKPMPMPGNRIDPEKPQPAVGNFRDASKPQPAPSRASKNDYGMGM